ncbi:MAG: ANTAR domain-containing protein [Lachnospiraceae bacterium]|nr:ANTAR domain-containing protein [Lachnospiraceae bacterium]
MSLQERTYSILVVSAAENFNTNLASLLPESFYYPIRTISNISSIRRAIADRPYDFVLINSPLSDDPGIRFAIDVCSDRETVVLLVVRNDIHDDIYNKVAIHGVFTLEKPTSKPTMAIALSWMISSREHLRHFEKKTLSIEKKMEEIRIVNRAKWLLISELNMSEPDAHRYIEKRAMDSCSSKRCVAEDIIKTYTERNRR